MTDQIPADKVRKLAARFRQQMEPHVSVAERVVWERAAEAVETLLHTPPTLADMTPEARRDCQWMQADTKPWGRAVIIVPDLSDGRAALLDIWGDVAYEDHGTVTPRPDLPRMTWPGDKKPAPAPALPDGWRLADHQKYGRVLVVRIFGDKAIYATPHEMLGIHTHVSLVSDLTFVDQEDNTPTGPNTLAVGSVWDDVDALARACDESGRDQIVVLDHSGGAYVWDEKAEWWEGSASPQYSPFKILHTGQEAAQ